MEGNEKMRLRWVRISPTLSDETVSFRVEGCAGMRLHEFIQTVLSDGSSHCGMFRVYAQSQELGHLHVCDIDYRERKVWWMFRYFRDSVLAMDALVSSARCNGGWGQMNYDVVIAWKGGEHAEA